MDEAMKADIRRYCGYPAYGSGAVGFQGWRFHQAYGLLEYRMSRLTDAEQKFVGQYLATLRHLAESPDSAEMFADWQRRLCGFLGVPSGPAVSVARAAP